MKTRSIKTRLPWIRAFSTATLIGLGCSSVVAQNFATIKTFGILTNVTGFNPYCQLVQAGDGTLYGTTYTGEGTVAGTVFKVQSDGSGFSVLRYFTNSVAGANPRAGLTLSDNVLYGTTENGGSSSEGTVFRLNTDGTGFTVLRSFSYSDGTHLVASLVLDGSVLYGTTTNGGGLSYGTVFKVNTDGTGFTVLKDFTWSDGANPYGGLVLSGGVLYGTTTSGGSAGAGTVFKINTNGTGFAVLKEFSGSEGAKPSATLTLSGNVLYGTMGASFGGDGGTIFKLNTDGTGFTIVLNYFGQPEEYLSGQLLMDGSVLYGTTSGNDPSMGGTVFKINTDGTGFTSLKEFSGNDGANPQGGVVLSGGLLYGTTLNGGIVRQGTVFKLSTNGTDFSVLKDFSYSDALNPYAALLVSGTVIYGTTYAGGSLGKGTVFQMNSDGTGYTVLKSFTGNDGANPQASLALSSNVLYGTTLNGGNAGAGTLFKVNTDGSGYTVLRHLTTSDGRFPRAGLVVSGNTLYGTTSLGGAQGAGTVFAMKTDGAGFTVLKNFLGSDGGASIAGLTLSGNVLYGTTALGGSSGKGTVFKLNTNGTGYQVLKHFTGSGDGRNPAAGLMLSGGVLYGTTTYGGNQDRGTVFKLNTDGTDYGILAELSGNSSEPLAGLVLNGSVLYGTSSSGGNSAFGTVFKLNTDGTGFTVIKQFSGSDGARPQADLALVGEVLYGTTYYGGNGGGTVFKLSVSASLPVIQCTNRTVECGSEWAIIPPAVIDPACTNPGLPTLTGAFTNTVNCPVITLTWQYTNCLQQTASCEQTILIMDYEPPVVFCPTNKTVLCGTEWSFDTPTGIDNCSGTNVTIISSGDPAIISVCPLVLGMSWGVYDACGNLGNPGSCSQLVTVVATNPPALVCPTNRVIFTSNTDAVEVQWSLSATAACGNIAGVTSSPPSGTSFLPGTTNTVTAWAWTECLLTNSCSFTVTVVHTPAPTFLGFNTGPFHSILGALDAPTDGAVLQVMFNQSVTVDTFVPIISSDPLTLLVTSGGVTVPAGQSNGVVRVSSLQLGNVTLTATYEATQLTAQVAVIQTPIIPALSIETLPGGMVRLAWTTNAVDFLLETKSTLAAPGGWVVFATNYSILGTNYVATDFLSNLPSRFFRLHKP